MNVSYLKDRSFRAIKDRKTEELLGYDLGDLLVGALWLALSEPLDDPQFDDLSVTDKQRLREAGF